MFVGFDYGSANCAIGVLEDDKVRLLPIAGTSNYLISTLYAMDRELIAEAVYWALPEAQKADYAKKRAAQLSRARLVRHELDLDAEEVAVFVGEEALAAYLEMPEEGFYVRSPKSFLGATGLRAEQVALFEDIVTLMMQHIKARADALTGCTVTHAVIGRPVNFQGIGGEQSNRQAEAILTLAARRAGFEEVAFLYEPLAAGMDFEASLTQEKTVLVVDVGGGTTDCSMVKMGPARMGHKDRSADCLGHSGQRIGGNDLDIALAMQGFMPHLGLDSQMLTGKPMPSQPFWNAVAVNDISAQREFAALSTRKLIDELMRDACSPELIQRLSKVQRQQLSYQLVRSAESAKIALSETEQLEVSLTFVDKALTANVDSALFTQAIAPSLGRIVALMRQAVADAGVMPEVIYVTGGTARSPAIYEGIAALYPQVPLVVGDHFGSVTAGLTRRAAQLFVAGQSDRTGNQGVSF